MDKVEIDIERLVLRGLDPADRYRIGTAIESELVRLFSEEGTPKLLTRSQEIPQLRLATLEITPGSKPVAIGIGTAREVYRGLGL